MVRVNQGGSILNFVIIGAVLALVLVGGAFAVRQNTHSPREGALPAPASAPAPTDNKQDNPSDDGDNAPAAGNNSAPAPDSSTRQNNSSSTAQPPVVSAPTAGKLPSSGPAEIFSSIIILGLLSSLSVAYVRSRRDHATALTSLL